MWSKKEEKWGGEGGGHPKRTRPKQWTVNQCESSKTRKSIERSTTLSASGMSGRARDIQVQWPLYPDSPSPVEGPSGTGC